jgi:soluble lytic murein transglycosylase-like protein
MTSAASYWASRAYQKAKLYPKIAPMRALAMQHPRTFYGLLAIKTEGYGYDFNWTMPELTKAHIDRLNADKTGAQVLSLIKKRQLTSAEDMLFGLPIDNNPKLAEAAIALAHYYNLAGYAMRFSLSNANPAGGYYDAGLFPISAWTTHEKFKDQAMLNAFIRQESRFRAKAKNSSGATGLMQIMPATAAYITGETLYQKARGQELLGRADTNVAIGAAYLDHLKKLDVVESDLFNLAIAYNAGPGNLARWKQAFQTDDRLLFIELIPSSETRAFVERIVTNYWVYQLQMGIEPTTLKAVAEGRAPLLK